MDPRSDAPAADPGPETSLDEQVLRREALRALAVLIGQEVFY